ncbi:MAG: PQQ-binding-like beta-propeller repeat protein [Planctomycetes bacterium]|nr:PQQ-binding-like beta-propeller repeat protein [Planctomycetota bacterium]
MRWWCGWILGGLLAPALTPAQDRPEDAQRNTALVRQYPYLDLLLSKAAALTQEGRYRDVLDLYAEAVGRFPNHLVPVPVESSIPMAPVHYRGVLEHCFREMEKWPEEGKAAYRTYYDGFARAAFETARHVQDLQALDQVAQRYPLSSVADDALALLGNLAMDAGDPEHAASAFERLLAVPDADIPRSLTFARLGAAYAQSGRADDLDELLARAERECPQTNVRFGDREEPLPQILRRTLRSMNTSADSSHGVAWPAGWECLQGDGTGTRPAESTALSNRAWTATIPPVEFEAAEDDPGYFPPTGRAATHYRPLFPAVSDGIVYLHHEYQAWAFNLYGTTADLLWSHSVTPPDGTLLYEERLAHTTSVHDGRVYVTLVTALGEMEKRMQWILVKFAFPKRALFCLDATTGKMVWRLGGLTDDKEPLGGLSFPTAPTPQEGRLYVGAVRQSTNTDPFEHYVLCLDAATGRVLWQTFVASGGTEINLFGNSTRESIGGAVAVAGDSVYYCTNHGAFAALDRRTGRMKWLYRYQQLSVNPTRSVQIRRNPLEWCNAAPVVAQDQVFFTATDSPLLYALDARTGEYRWRLERGDLRHLYGMQGPYLVAGGDSVRWFDVTQGGKTAGHFEPERGQGSGRGVVAADGIYFPTTEGLYQIPIAGGKPTFTRWPGGRGQGGNLVAGEGALILTGQTWIDAFFDRRDREAEIAADLARDPNSAPLIYRSALRLLQCGRVDQAAELFAQVVETASRSRRAEEQRLARVARRRLYAGCMEAGRKALQEKNAVRARSLFGRAREHAPDQAALVETTLRLCELEPPESAVAELQRLIFEHGEELVEGRRVAEIVRARIASLISESGTSSYRRFEDEARDQLEHARREGTAEAHLAVWRRYPNSSVVEAAVLEAAEAYERVGRPEDAAMTLRLFLREFPRSARLADAGRALVRMLEARRQFIEGRKILRRMLESSPDPETRAFCEERLARKEYHAPSTASSPPSLKPPLKRVGAYVERESSDQDSVAELAVLCPEGSGPSKPGELIYVVKDGRVFKAVRPDTGLAAWELTLDGRPRAFAQEGSLLICTERTVWRLNAAEGTVEWKYESPVPMDGFALTDMALCVTSPDPRGEQARVVTAIRASDGSILWTQAYAGLSTPEGLLAMEDGVALVTTKPSRLYVFEVDSGRCRVQQALSSSGGEIQMLGAVQGLIYLHVKRAAVEAYDATEGTLQWRRDLQEFGWTKVCLSRGGVFILGRRDRRTVASLVDLRHGKLVRVNDVIPVEQEPQVLVDDAAAYVVSPAPERNGVLALGIPFEKLVPSWMTEMDLPGPLVGLGLRAAADHLVVFGVGAAETRRFHFAAAILDKTGKVVQNIKGGDPSRRAAGCDLAGDALFILADNRVEVYR